MGIYICMGMKLAIYWGDTHTKVDMLLGYKVLIPYQPRY